ncbi:MAG: selenoneine biosynthesis selenosugar synthase SenB [Pseudomonadota bacterium]
MPVKSQHLLIISPALAKANNGNWQTAQRWAKFLQKRYRVQCAIDWNAAVLPVPDLMIALHARRSAPSIVAFALQFPQRPIVLILTGTDLYRDIRNNVDAQRSLSLATRLVVLQPGGLEELTPTLRAKAHTIFQSTPALPSLPLSPSLLSSRQPIIDNKDYTVVMIGHLRAEKRPETFMQAASYLTHENVRLLHIGRALEPLLGVLAEQTAAKLRCYEWLGARTHAQTLRCLRRSALMVICSEMEGGANVIVEAVTSGVPVLASDISGNRGMLGTDYAGYFPLGDAIALAGLIDRAASDAAFYAQLQSQCAGRAILFSPALEKAAVLELADNCLLSLPGMRQTGHS